MGLFDEKNALARCCIIDYDGDVLMDLYCEPKGDIIDYRTAVSGITPQDLLHAPPFLEVRAKAARILDGKILIGQSVHYDLEALGLSHPLRMIRDTHRCPFLYGRGGKSLKNLAAQYLGRAIQTGEHDPVEDARAALDLYKLVKGKWEKCYR